MKNSQKEKYSFKKDKYLKVRGGTAQFYYLFCASCGEYVALYQKDGPGGLLRLYLDRIFESHHLTDLHVKGGDLSALKCQKCGILLGVSAIYKRENRPVFRLARGLLHKKSVMENLII